MTLLNHIQHGPHQQGHCALITGYFFGGTYFCFFFFHQALFSKKGGLTLLLLHLWWNFWSRQNRSRVCGCCIHFPVWHSVSFSLIFSWLMLPPKAELMNYRLKEEQRPFHSLFFEILEVVTLAWMWRWWWTGGHAEGRTFNLAEEVELIPLLPVYTRSSKVSLFSLSWHSSISSIYLLPPLSCSWVNTHTNRHSLFIYVTCVCVCVCSASIFCPRSITRGERLNGSVAIQMINSKKTGPFGSSSYWVFAFSKCDPT